MTNDNYDLEMDLLTSQEEEDWQRFLKVFSKKNHPPVLPNINLSWRFWLTLIGSVGAIALSAFRTSSQFYIVASQSSQEPLFVWGETIAAVGAVNILLVSLATMNAYRTKKVSDFSMTWGVVIAILISGLAGLGQAFRGLEITQLTEFFNWALAFAMGAGVTALEYFGGDMIGVELVRYELDKQTNKKTFDEQAHEWAANARKQFSGWVMRKTNKRSELHTEQTNKPSSNKQVRHQSSERSTNNSGEQTIRSYLDNAMTNEQRTLGVSELARLLAANEHPEYSNEQIEEFVRRTKGYISQVRKTWISELNVPDTV